MPIRVIQRVIQGFYSQVTVLSPQPVGPYKLSGSHPAPILVVSSLVLGQNASRWAPGSARGQEPAKTAPTGFVHVPSKLSVQLLPPCSPTAPALADFFFCAGEAARASPGPGAVAGAAGGGNKGEGAGTGTGELARDVLESPGREPSWPVLSRKRTHLEVGVRAQRSRRSRWRQGLHRRARGWRGWGGRGTAAAGRGPGSWTSSGGCGCTAAAPPAPRSPPPRPPSRAPASPPSRPSSPPPGPPPPSPPAAARASS